MSNSHLNIIPTREHLLHALAEAAEFEHCLMCTYLYAAFSLKTGADEGLSSEQLEATQRWRRCILEIATEEMGHLVAVWNIQSALGGAPRIGRFNFPLDPGALPAGVVVKLAPFNQATLQHFVHLERPADSSEPDSAPFAPERIFQRGADSPRLTPMAIDYDTVGTFYELLGKGLTRFVGAHGESIAFCGDPALQLNQEESSLPGVNRVICLKTVLRAFAAIITQGEGAAESSEHSHFHRFAKIRAEYAALLAADPAFEPAFPAATNPVLRQPPRPEGRIWIEDPRAIATTDLANSSYGLMLRLLAYTYAVPSGSPDKQLSIDLAMGLMKALTVLAERAARLPAGPSNPSCNAGVSFIALRDAAALPPGPSARRFFVERIHQLATAAEAMRDPTDARTQAAASILSGLARRATQGFDLSSQAPAPRSPDEAKREPGPPDPKEHANMPPPENDSAKSLQMAAHPDASASPAIEVAEADNITVLYEGKRCIHARHCVTQGPTVFLANVKGPWIHPETMDAERVAELAHICPSGAIRYRRKDGRPEEAAPPVNLAAIREGGPYAFRGDLRINGEPDGFRATLCRCGASKNKPYCDGSHHDVHFDATGEPATGTSTDMLAVRDGPLEIDPQVNGPLQVRGNLEITSGTGRMVARVTSAKLCRCGGSQNKPYCDGTHSRIGFVAP
jgi:CDGSH-type Zn-finger protein/uncharacterized Fe-S cluster protein YjdI